MGDELKGAIYEKAKTKQFEKYRAISLQLMIQTQLKEMLSLKAVI